MNRDEAQDILQRRAAALARVERAPRQETAARRMLCFHLGEEEYAVEAGGVREVFAIHDLTPVPCTPDFVVGIVHLRGQILSIVDLKRFFDIPKKGLGSRSHVVVVTGAGLDLGLLADGVGRLRELPDECIQAPPATFSDRRLDYVLGLTREGTVVLDLARVLGDERLVVNEEV